MFYKFTNNTIACENCEHWLQHYVYQEKLGFISTNCGHCVLEVDKRLFKHTKPEQHCKKFKYCEKCTLEEALQK